jgi:hypothetical protein
LEKIFRWNENTVFERGTEIRRSLGSVLMRPVIPLVAIAMLLAACTTPGPKTRNAEAVRYRYENTLDLHTGGTLSHVVVLGHDDAKLGEATRLVVSAGGTPVTLRNSVDVNGAMYCPAVEAMKNGHLLVRWDVIDEGWEKVELAADAAGNLRVVRRTSGQR